MLNNTLLLRKKVKYRLAPILNHYFRNDLPCGCPEADITAASGTVRSAVRQESLII